MEFWVVILTLWAFYRWVASRIRRQKEDERFARVVEALNHLEPRLKDINKLESRVKELEQRLASPKPPDPAEAEQHAATAPPPAIRKPVEPPPPVVPAAPEIPKPVPPVVAPLPGAPALPPRTPATSEAPGIELPATQPFSQPKPITPPPLHRPHRLRARQHFHHLEGRHRSRRANSVHSSNKLWALTG